MCLIIIKVLNESHGKSIFETTSMIQSNSEEFIMTNSTEEYSKKLLNNVLVALKVLQIQKHVWIIFPFQKKFEFLFYRLPFYQTAYLSELRSQNVFFSSNFFMPIKTNGQEIPNFHNFLLESQNNTYRSYTFLNL